MNGEIMETEIYSGQSEVLLGRAHRKSGGKGKFEKYLAKKGMVVIEESPDEAGAGVPNSILDVIYRKHKILVPMLASAAIFIRSHAKDLTTARFQFKVENQNLRVHKLFMDMLDKHGLISHYEIGQFEKTPTFRVAFTADADRLMFFRSKWAEASFRNLTMQTVRNYLHQTAQKIPHRLLHNVKIAKIGEEDKILAELDLVLEIGDRFYIVEVKSGPWIRILQWARNEILFKGPQARVMTCTTYPGIPPEIFEPQILLTLDSFETELLRFLENDLNVKTPTTLSKEAMWREHDGLGMEEEEYLDFYECEVDHRTLAQRLNEDVFHISSPDNFMCHTVRGTDGEYYDDYDMNAYLD